MPAAERPHHPAEAGLVPGALTAGGQNAASGGQARTEGGEDVAEGGCAADGGQAGAPQEAAHHGHIRQIVEGLQQIGPQQGQGKTGQGKGDLAAGQIKFQRNCLAFHDGLSENRRHARRAHRTCSNKP